MQAQRLSSASPLHESQNYHCGQSAPEDRSQAKQLSPVLVIARDPSLKIKSIFLTTLDFFCLVAAPAAALASLGGVPDANRSKQISQVRRKGRPI